MNKKNSKSKINLLLILEATQGGTRLHVIDLIEGIQSNYNDHLDLHFIYSTKRADINFLNWIRSSKLTNKLELPIYRNISVLFDLYVLFRVVLYIFQKDIDIVHGHSSKGGYIAKLSAFITARKCVYTPNSSPFRLSRFYKLLEKISAVFTDYIIAVCKSEKEELVDNNIFKETKIIVINSGIKNIEPPKSKSNIKKNDEIIIGTIGRIDYQKGPYRFIKIIKNLVHNYEKSNLRFIWIGEGPLLDDFKKNIESCNLEKNVEIIPWQNNVDSFLKFIDIFILTSEYESFGYVTLEAMRLSKPCVVTKVTGSVDLIKDGYNGFLIEKDNIYKFSDKLNVLIGDKELRKSFGENGKKRWMNEFHFDQMVYETVNLYRKVKLNSR